LVPQGRKLFKAHPWCPQMDTVRFPAPEESKKMNVSVCPTG